MKKQKKSYKIDYKIGFYVLLGMGIMAVLGSTTKTLSSIGINDDNSEPHPSAMLDVKSTKRGAVFPRMTQTQRTAISSPVTGLLVYQTDGRKGYYHYNGTAWIWGVSFHDALALNTNGTAPDASAILDVKSTTKGVVFPRMTQTQRTAIPSPVTGLLVYQTDGRKGYYYHDGTAWQQLPSQNNATPVGTIVSFGGPKTSIPSGWASCDGNAVSRTSAPYKDLFAVIGTAWGEGDGSTTFNLPDLRGMFLRGVNDTRTGQYSDPNAGARTASNAGGNTGNNVGSVQLNELKQHDHGKGSLGGGTNMRGNHFHQYQKSIYSSNGDNASSPGFSKATTSLNTSSSGDHSHSLNITGRVANTGGDETRPNNAYVYYIIKL